MGAVAQKLDPFLFHHALSDVLEFADLRTAMAVMYANRACLQQATAAILERPLGRAPLVFDVG